LPGTSTGDPAFFIQNEKELDNENRFEISYMFGLGRSYFSAGDGRGGLHIFFDYRVFLGTIDQWLAV
jgi:hypothetical protein